MTEAAGTGTGADARPAGDPHVVCSVDELPVGARRIVDVDGRSVGVLNVDGRYHALRNHCPHHGAPLCEGVVKGTMAPSAPHEYAYGQHNQWITCPWHGFEYSLETGRPLLTTERGRVRVYPVRVEDGNVVLYA